MESNQIGHRRTERTKSKKQDILDNIAQEYCLKRNQFDPKKSSPDMFSKKLQHRMKLYYKTLYTLSSTPSKY